MRNLARRHPALKPVFYIWIDEDRALSGQSLGGSDGSAFVVIDTGADGRPEKLTDRLDDSDSANHTEDLLLLVVGRIPFEMIDHNGLDRGFARLELQAKVLHGLKH